VTTDCVAAETAALEKQGSDAASDDAGSVCLPHVQLRFGALDAALVEAALEADPEAKSVFSPLTDRMRSSSSDHLKMPESVISAQADSLVLGPVTLQKPTMHLRSKAGEIQIANWEAATLGGSAKGTGSIVWDGGKPEYSLEGSFTQLSGSAVATLLDGRWAGGSLDGSGKVTLSGLAPKDLASSAVGDLHFDWQHGSIFVGGLVPGSAPASGTRFDDWSGVAAIGAGKLEAGKSSMIAGRRSYSVQGTMPFGEPAKLTLTAADGAGGGKGESKAADRK
jgi:hypothetical protein